MQRLPPEKASKEIINLLRMQSLPPKPIAIFDLDDTLIDSYNRPILPILYVFDKIKEMNILPFIITARPATEIGIKYTREQLKVCGIGGYKKIYYRPVAISNIADFKLMSRRHISDQGYNAIFSVGDMEWDSGRWGGKGFLLDRYSLCS